MKSLAWIRCLATLIFLTISINSHAFFIQATDPRFGINSVSIDTSTNLAWLDLNFTKGRTYIDVASETRPNGDFSGYRYATPEEINNLFDEFGFFGQISPGVNTDAFFQLFGSTSAQDGFPEIFGWASNALVSSPNIYGLDFDFDPSNPQYSIERGDILWQNPRVIFGSTGSWLVQVIPEPATLPLIVIGFLGFLIVGRRHQRQTSHPRSLPVRSLSSGCQTRAS